MIDGRESRMRDEIVALRASVIRMRPPAHVGQQTRRMSQSAFGLVFLDLSG